MDGDFAAGDLEGNLLSGAAHGDGDLGAGGAFHEADHAVLRELDAGDYPVIDFDDAVPRQETGLFRRASGYYFQDDGGVRRDIELYADALEAAGQLLFRIRQFHRRKIN